MVTASHTSCIASRNAAEPVLGKARVCGRAPAPGATGRAVGGPLGRGDAGAEVALLAGGRDDGCGSVLVALTAVAAGDEPAPQPVSSAAAMTAAANGVRSPAGEGDHPSIMPDRPRDSPLGQDERTRPALLIPRALHADASIPVWCFNRN